jgi:hypothetical protein
MADLPSSAAERPADRQQVQRFVIGRQLKQPLDSLVVERAHWNRP